MLVPISTTLIQASGVSSAWLLAQSASQPTTAPSAPKVSLSRVDYARIPPLLNAPAHASHVKATTASPANGLLSSSSIKLECRAVWKVALLATSTVTRYAKNAKRDARNATKSTTTAQPASAATISTPSPVSPTVQLLTTPTTTELANNVLPIVSHAKRTPVPRVLLPTNCTIPTATWLVLRRPTWLPTPANASTAELAVQAVSTLPTALLVFLTITFTMIFA